VKISIFPSPTGDWCTNRLWRAPGNFSALASDDVSSGIKIFLQDLVHDNVLVAPRTLRMRLSLENISWGKLQKERGVQQTLRWYTLECRSARLLSRVCHLRKVAEREKWSTNSCHCLHKFCWVNTQRATCCSSLPFSDSYYFFFIKARYSLGVSRRPVIWLLQVNVRFKGASLVHGCKLPTLQGRGWKKDGE